MTKPGATPPGAEDEMGALVALYLATRRADFARLDDALAAGDFGTIRAIGHAFRGSSAPYGFPEAGRIGAALEEAAARGDRAAVEALLPRLRMSLPREEGGNP